MKSLELTAKRICSAGGWGGGGKRSVKNTTKPQLTGMGGQSKSVELTAKTICWEVGEGGGGGGSLSLTVTLL